MSVRTKLLLIKGDSEGCRVYRVSAGEPFVAMVVGILCSILTGFRPPQFFTVLDVALVLYGILSFRRAFLLSATALFYRAAIGKLVKMPLQEIVSVQRTVATTGIEPGPAISITMAGGCPLVLPRTVEDPDEFVTTVADAAVRARSVQIVRE